MRQYCVWSELANLFFNLFSDINERYLIETSAWQIPENRIDNSQRGQRPVGKAPALRDRRPGLLRRDEPRRVSTG